MRGRQKEGLSEESPLSTIRHDQVENSNGQFIDDGKYEELVLGEKKFRTALGLLAILFLVLGVLTSTNTSSETAVEEVKNRISTSTKAGFTLNKDIAVDLESKDFKIEDFNGTGNARMLVWDFLGNSGNEIQILVDGKVLREVHILNSNVAAYSVPVPSVVTIRGLKGTGAITYAVKFPDRKQTVFNVVSTNGTNQYTLVPRF